MFALLVFGLFATLCVPHISAAELEKREPPLYSFYISCPSENISPTAAAECTPLAGQYLYNVVYDQYQYGPIYIGISSAFPNNPYFPAVQFYYDPVHTSFNVTNYNPNNNLIVVQSSQGEAINYPYVPPDTQFWVVNDFTLDDENEVLLYGVTFPGWTACAMTDSSTGGTYYQLFYQHFDTGCTAVEVIATYTAPPPYTPPKH